MGATAPSRRRFAHAMIGVAALGLGLPALSAQYLRALGPLDIAAAGQGSSIAVDRDGRLLRAFTTDDGRWRLPLSVADVDPRFLDMLRTYEDRRFEEHRGLDFRAFARAGWQLATNLHIVSGGSTLTMQVARLLEPRDQRTPSAKLRQIARAVELEQRFGKDQILDLYLELAPYGGNLEGLRAASLAYFGKEPRRLSLSEQALLVALPQSPEVRRPDRNPRAALTARNRVLDRVTKFGLITQLEADAAKHDAMPEARKLFPTLAAHASEAAHDADRPRRVLRFTYDLRLQVQLEQLAKEAAERLG
ncbi:MAG: pbpC, partial [Hyphomicrobiales bacterium]|nr:pbpC [Hyphomicrobiales bacterium]